MSLPIWEETLGAAADAGTAMAATSPTIVSAAMPTVPLSAPAAGMRLMTDCAVVTASTLAGDKSVLRAVCHRYPDRDRARPVHSVQAVRFAYEIGVVRAERT